MWMIDFTDTIDLDNGIRVNRNNMCSARYSGGGGHSETQPTISPEQRAAIQRVMDYAEPAMQGRPSTEGYSGQLVADTPASFTSAYADYTGGQYSDISNQAMQDLISGKPAYEFDPVKTTSRWKETYAEPVMQAWRDTVAPIVKEGYNAPGTLWSRTSGVGMENAANRFYGSQVAPSLFGSLEAGEARGVASQEAAAARQPGALQLPYAQFVQQAGAAGAYQQQQQAPLSAAYQEYLRTDPFKYAQLVAGVGTAQTQENIAYQGTDYGSSMIGAGATIGAAMIMSDIKTKENFETTDSALDKISKLKSYKFNFKDDEEQRSGIMAQHLEAVMPEAVKEVKGIKYIKIDSVLGLLIDGINELRKEN